MKIPVIPVIPKFKTSIKHLKVLKNTGETYLSIEESLKSKSEKEKAVQGAIMAHNPKLRKIVEDKKFWIDKFLKSVPASLKELRTFKKEEFSVVLSYVDFAQEPTAHLSLECFIEKISIVPFCRYHRISFPERLNPYNEQMKDIEIEKYGIRALLHLQDKTGDEYDIVVDIESDNFKINENKGITFWNVEYISSKLPEVMIDSIQYKSISSRKTIKQFKKMIGFNKLSKLAKELLQKNSIKYYK